MVDKEKVFEKIKLSGNLPTLPEILVKLLDACNSEGASLSYIASLISKDPVLTFKVLQLVNSAYYSVPRRFTGIEPAVVYLGANSIRNLAVATSIHQVFDRGRFSKIKHFNLNDFWWHSLLCATLARRIAVKTGFASQDEAYLAGLLHDVGRLVLVSTFPKEHEAILLDTQDENNKIWAENQLIGVNHCEAGYWLVGEWKINSLMAESIRCHHDSIEHIGESFPLIKIVYLANVLSKSRSGVDQVAEIAERLLSFSPEALQKIVDGATEEILAIAEGFEVRLKPPGQRKRKARQNQTEQLETAQMAAIGGEVREDGLEGDRPATELSDAEQELLGRVKSVSLLSGFLETLSRCGESTEIIASFEQCLNVLFDIDKVLFFLPDRDNVLLVGRASENSTLHDASEGLVLAVQRSSSMIVASYRDQSETSIHQGEHGLQPSDHQILLLMQCQAALCIPLGTVDQPVGVVVLGLPKGLCFLSIEDRKLIRTIARQAGLSLSIDRMKKSKAEEIEAERLAAISMTARKFAHEVNNPLGIISNYLTSLKLKLPDAAEVSGDLDIIGEEISRISTMVSRLGFFSRETFVDYEEVNVNEVVADIVRLVKTTIFSSEDKVLTFVPDQSLVNIRTSPSAIKQIVINLLKNSGEALVDGGRVEIRTKLLRQGGDEGDTPGVELIIDDNGPGLPQNVRENLFQPFFTTKGTGHSGLGLSIVYKAVTDLGGDITCSGGSTSGTRFTIHLPSVPERATDELR
ncbi:HDOD domain-containing protein [Desulfofustis glycolicus]|uniref:histidine kinase n=1 Tax=Desulfofustis glycolicus DSM 9705 TaxID=1121409 RepID=A0A1M5W996_9BACT|nr:HDOD domain-containing protein [Desulfofustis glycolicus]MCB2217353.1 HDOD domain-containing protein [Desulfobulbaceae bacterium]SHH84149.1 HD-like signal output (HDOD) domain, no enzymatic activity [Desulfofustis glycolicus DSM 9705]